MDLMTVLNNIDFNSFESATGVIGDLQYTLTNKGKLNLPPNMHGAWQDYVVRNCKVLNQNRLNAGLAKIDMLMTFSVMMNTYAMEVIIEDAPKPIDIVSIDIEVPVDNNIKRTRGPNKIKQVI